MPSRLMHEFLVHVIETCDVDYQEPETIEVRGLSGFQQMYMGQFLPHITLRRTLRGAELHDLPVNLYQELLSLLDHLVRTGERIDISRRFRGVRLIHMDMMMNPESFDNDFRLEFVCDSFDAEETVRERQRRDAEAMRMQEMMSQPRRSAYLPTDWFDEKKNEPKKKVEEHFDKDLFEV